MKILENKDVYHDGGVTRLVVVDEMPTFLNLKRSPEKPKEKKK